ncbi:MAG: Xaa-Pro peptidase family protein [Candidatus Bathyarchaeota archaeon]|nr:Xaa-Pro peptidase family protein [Candidatus Termiticorpusculum sp.]
MDSNRLFRFRSCFPEGVNNFLILDDRNIFYFTGFSGASAFLVPLDGECVLYVRGTNFEQACHEVKNVRVELLGFGESLFQRLRCDVSVSVGAKLAVDFVGVDVWLGLVGVFGGGCVVLGGDVIKGLRAVKSSGEVECIRRACEIADVGMRVAGEVIGVGVSELDVLAEVEYAMRRAGSGGVAFDTIVSSGVGSAFPHGACVRRVIGEGDLVVVDLGAVFGGYRSDVTRTFVAGRVSGRHREVFDVVMLAHDLAFEAVRSGVLCSEVDRIAREFLVRVGFGDCFVHNLGHGVGLDIHEAPVLGPNSRDVLKVGSVVTIEPGVYVVGFGGVRIEDTVLVTENGLERLTGVGYCLDCFSKV